MGGWQVFSRTVTPSGCYLAYITLHLPQYDDDDDYDDAPADIGDADDDGHDNVDDYDDDDDNVGDSEDHEIDDGHDNDEESNLWYHRLMIMMM